MHAPRYTRRRCNTVIYTTRACSSPRLYGLGWRCLGRVANAGRVTRVVIHPGPLDFEALGVPRWVYDDVIDCRLLGEKHRLLLSIGGVCGELGDTTVSVHLPAPRLGFLAGCHEFLDTKLHVHEERYTVEAYLGREPGFYPCGFALSEALDPNVEEDLLRVEIRCTSPTSAECVCEGPECNLVERIEAYEWGEYWSRWRDHRGHILVSNRWAGRCGLHTRIYIREDGAIVASHDENGYEGVHVVIPRGRGARRAKRLYELYARAEEESRGVLEEALAARSLEELLEALRRGEERLVKRVAEGR